MEYIAITRDHLKKAFQQWADVSKKDIDHNLDKKSPEYPRACADYLFGILEENLKGK